MLCKGNAEVVLRMAKRGSLVGEEWKEKGGSITLRAHLGLLLRGLKVILKV